MSEYIDLFESGNPGDLAGREGSSYDLTVTLFQPATADNADPPPRDLTGWTVTPYIKNPNQSFSGENAPSNFSITNLQLQLGTFTIHLDDSHLLTENLYPYAVEISDGNDRETVLTGRFEILARIAD